MIGIVIIIIIIILLSYFIKLNKTIKIIYFIIITALILYLIKDKFSKKQIEEFIFDILEGTEEKLFIKTGKNFYIQIRKTISGSR